MQKPKLVMRSTRTTKAIFSCLLATIVIILTNCTSASGPEPEWAKKNKELIKEYNLTERELSGLPESKVASNLEPAKVTGKFYNSLHLPGLIIFCCASVKVKLHTI